MTKLNRGAGGAFLVLLLLGAGPAAAQTAGEELYQQNCAGCHGPAGEGRGAYPALADNPTADAAHVEQVIREGARGMPGFSRLPDADIAALTEYTLALAGGDPAAGGDDPPGTDPAAPPTEPLPPGDPARGEAYFLGSARLAEGGAPCAACHEAANTGGIGGGRLATDLTDVDARLGGAEGVAASLENPAFAVMRASYDGRPLSAQERSDLAAFFAAVGAGERGEPSVFLPPFWFIGALATIALFVVMGVAHSRRGPSPARRIRGKA